MMGMNFYIMYAVEDKILLDDIFHVRRKAPNMIDQNNEASIDVNDILAEMWCNRKILFCSGSILS